MQTRWYKIAQEGELPIDQVLTATAGVNTVCLIHTEEHGYTALDNRCPHQGGPLGEGQLDGRRRICPWHGYEVGNNTYSFGPIIDLSVDWFSGRLVADVDPADEEHADEQIAFGFSTGDERIPEPYFYVTAYPLSPALVDIKLSEVPIGTPKVLLAL